MASTDTVYAGVEALMTALNGAGFTSLARTLEHRMRHVAWTSSSELLDELQDVLKRELSSGAALPEEIRGRIGDILADIDTLV